MYVSMSHLIQRKVYMLTNKVKLKALFGEVLFHLKSYKLHFNTK